MLMALLGLTGIWSSVSNSIYFPALPSIAAHYNVSPEIMNLSVVGFSLFQGLAPTFVSTMADTVGRRPLIILSLTVYIGICIGISRVNTYWLLAFLRCVQAIGISPVIAINLGVSGDVCTPQTRGGFVGFVSGMLIVGNAFGSVIGAALISRWGWRSVFIFLAIGAGVTLLLIIVFLPETCRSVVGNGSIWPLPLHRAPALYFPGYRKHITNDMSTLAKRVPVDVRTPFRIVIEPKFIACLLPAGLQFAAWTMALTTMSTTLEKAPFNYSVMHVGLMYLPQGICSLIGSISAGRALNYYYRYRLQQHEEKFPTKEEQRLNPFNRVRVRIDLATVPTMLTITGLVLYGWMLGSVHSVPAAVVASCLISLGCSSFVSIATTMLVDLNPGRALAAASSVNLVRCVLAAAGVAALDKMEKALTIGGCFTLLAGFCLLADILLVFVVRSHGRKIKAEARGETGADKAEEKSADEETLSGS